MEQNKPRQTSTKLLKIHSVVQDFGEDFSALSSAPSASLLDTKKLKSIWKDPETYYTFMQNAACTPNNILMQNTVGTLREKFSLNYKSALIGTSMTDSTLIKVHSYNMGFYH